MSDFNPPELPNENEEEETEEVELDTSAYNHIDDEEVRKALAQADKDNETDTYVLDDNLLVGKGMTVSFDKNRDKVSQLEDVIEFLKR